MESDNDTGYGCGYASGRGYSFYENQEGGGTGGDIVEAGHGDHFCFGKGDGASGGRGVWNGEAAGYGCNSNADGFMDGCGCGSGRGCGAGVLESDGYN